MSSVFGDGAGEVMVVTPDPSLLSRDGNTSGSEATSPGNRASSSRIQARARSCRPARTAASTASRISFSFCVASCRISAMISCDRVCQLTTESTNFLTDSARTVGP